MTTEKFIIPKCSPPIGELVFATTINIRGLSKERARFSKGHAYTPKRTREYEKYIADTVEMVLAENAVDYPVSLGVSIQVKVPKSWPAVKAALAYQGVLYPTVGDLDNKLKAVSDALNGLVYIDDNLICAVNAVHYYGADDKVAISVVREGINASLAVQLYKEQLAYGRK